MNILKIVTKPRNIFQKKLSETSQLIQQNTFYRFNDILKTELHYQKHYIQNYEYFKVNGEEECHIDIVTYTEEDDVKIRNNKLIQKLVKQTIAESDTLVEMDFLKSRKKPSYEINNIFLL